jgi:tetratricopeptide (TPR) repeat protein
MTTQPFKTILLDLLQQAHLDEEAFLQGLDETERAAIGTPVLWCAKDHIAHITFWQQQSILSLTAVVQHQEQPPRAKSVEELNSETFEQQRLRPWSDILSEYQQTYAEFMKLTVQLSEEDLTAPHRFDWLPEGDPLYTRLIGNCYEHPQEHLAQYYLDRHDLSRATRIRETCADRVLQPEMPDLMKGNILYNLACFYALQNQLEKAATTLQEALTLAPRLKEWSLTDPDLNALRSNQD